MNRINRHSSQKNTKGNDSDAYIITLLLCQYLLKTAPSQVNITEKYQDCILNCGYHILSHRRMIYDVMSYHVASCHIVSYHIVSYHIVQYHIMLYLTMYELYMITICHFSMNDYSSKCKILISSSRQSRIVKSGFSVQSLLNYLYAACQVIPLSVQSSRLISYHIISLPSRALSLHIKSIHIISYNIISYHIISYHVISYQIISSQLISC